MLFRSLFISVLLISSVVAEAQPSSTKVEVPAAVSQAFKSKYPAAKNITWSQADAKAYDADFESDGTAYTASFFQDGKWLQTESGIESDDLPQTVQDKLSKQFNGYLVTDAELIDHRDKGRLYNVHLERGEETVVLTFNEDGKVIEREKDDDEG
jgi:hypothetical protein